MINVFLDGILFILSLPFRLCCRRVGRGVRIASGYSFFGCHLENVTICDNVNIGSGAWIQTVPISKDKRPEVFIGENTNIGRNTVISAAGKISIGKNCLVSYRVSFMDHDHRYSDLSVSPLAQGITLAEDIVIREDCFIGAQSFILKGVKLGQHCVVGANSVVIQSFPDFSLIAGNPARLIRCLKNR